MAESWDKLLPKLRELTDLRYTINLLEWDQAVLMPPGGGASRARALSTLAGEAHKRLVDPQVGDLLDELAGDSELDDDRRTAVRLLKRDYDKAMKVPPDLVRELAEARGLAYPAWAEARKTSDWKLLEPHIAKIVGLKKAEADAIGWEGERYDALLDFFEPEMKTHEVEAVFDGLLPDLRPLADEILDATGPRPAFAGEAYDVEAQQTFCLWLVERVGFDLERGRLDRSPHPFTTATGAGDVRQTTRTDERDVLFSIYAALHETGHALYDQGLPEELRDLPVGEAPSLGMHESQSRLWENQVGRSRAFTEFVLPHLKEHFPTQMGLVDRDEFYAGVNHPQRTLIRVSADEVTYNLHVALRFELEVKMFRDELEVGDLPEVWREGMERYVGITPPDDATGVLQDMHWSIGALGYFPTYTLGTLYAAAFYDKAQADLGSLDDEIRAGDFERLLGWLRTNIHSQGYRLPGHELARKVLGEPLSPRPFLDYLRSKYLG